MANNQKAGDLTAYERRFSERLKATIADYWAERGHAVTLTSAESEFTQANRCCIGIVRSDMVNGYPRGVLSCTS